MRHSGYFFFAWNPIKVRKKCQIKKSNLQNGVFIFPTPTLSSFGVFSGYFAEWFVLTHCVTSEIIFFSSFIAGKDCASRYLEHFDSFVAHLALDPVRFSSQSTLIREDAE